MAILQIERHVAERLIALILREDLKLAPAKANEIALKVGIRMDAAAADLLRTGYGQGWRAIERHPPYYGDLVNEMVGKLRQRIPQADKELLDDAWEMIYEYGREIPDAVMVKP
ncbi:MAG TPA: hypothetical protein V6C72_09140 [Chroococcales cyanobacterium]